MADTVAATTTTTTPPTTMTTAAAAASPLPSAPPADAPPPPPPPAAKLKPSNFRLVRTLGTGTFARVCLVRPAAATSDLVHDAHAQVYALKILRKADVFRLKQVDHVRHERAVLADVAGHPFITNLLASFSDRDSLYMLLDYVPGGELFSYLRKLRRFDEHVARFYAAEYLAPEVIHNKGHTTAVDWWALGILVYEFLTGYPPFWHQNPIEIYKQIVEKPVTFPSEPPISDDAKHLIRSLCTADRSRRLGNISGGAARVKAHPFFRRVNWDDLVLRRRQGPILPPVHYPSDAQCFDTYPEEEAGRNDYTADMALQYDDYFRDF